MINIGVQIMAILKQEDQNSKELSALLQMDPEVASKTEGYANRIEELFLKTDNPRDNFKDNLENNYTMDLEGYIENLLDRTDDKEATTYNPDGATAPSKSEDTEYWDPDIANEAAEPSLDYSGKSLLEELHGRKEYVERNLEREFSKRPEDIDMKRVETLAEKVYTENN